MNPRSSFKRRLGAMSDLDLLQKWESEAKDDSAECLKAGLLKQELCNLRGLKSHLECTDWMFDNTCGNGKGLKCVVKS